MKCTECAHFKCELLEAIHKKVKVPVKHELWNSYLIRNRFESHDEMRVGYLVELLIKVLPEECSRFKLKRYTGTRKKQKK